MSGKKLLDAIGNVNDQFIMEFSNEQEVKRTADAWKKRRRRHMIRQGGALAACVLLAVGILPLVLGRNGADKLSQEEIAPPQNMEGEMTNQQNANDFKEKGEMNHIDVINYKEALYIFRKTAYIYAGTAKKEDCSIWAGICYVRDEKAGTGDVRCNVYYGSATDPDKEADTIIAELNDSYYFLKKKQ